MEQGNDGRELRKEGGREKWEEGRDGGEDSMEEEGGR